MNTNPPFDQTDRPDLQNPSAPIIERAPLPMVEVEGPDHLVHFVNPAFCRLLKVGREELLGKPFSDIVSNGASCVPLLDRVYQTGEFEIHANSDESESSPAYWLYAMWPALDAGGRPGRVIIQVTKSVQFRQHAAALNEALLIGGLRQHELRAAAEISNARLQVEIAERERTTLALQAAQAALRAHAHTLEAAVVERTAQLQKSVGELEAFSYSLAHDLRAPLRAIHGFTQIVLEMSHEEISPAAVQLLNRVIKAADRMDSLIRDVLSLSEVIRRPITLVPVDVDALVRALVQERPELSPPRAEIKIESPLLPILGHEASLSQCLTNLLANAVKFVEPGKVPDVRIWTEAFSAPASVEPPEPGMKSKASNPASQAMVRLWIEDHGIGVDAAAHLKIFEIFQRLHSSSQYEGTGIGLAIVRKAVERMGGRVGVKSEHGKGSRFWLEFPKG